MNRSNTGRDNGCRRRGGQHRKHRQPAACPGGTRGFASRHTSRPMPPSPSLDHAVRGHRSHIRGGHRQVSRGGTARQGAPLCRGAGVNLALNAGWSWLFFRCHKLGRVRGGRSGADGQQRRLGASDRAGRSEGRPRAFRVPVVVRLRHRAGHRIWRLNRGKRRCSRVVVVSPRPAVARSSGPCRAAADGQRGPRLLRPRSAPGGVVGPAPPAIFG